MSLRQPIKTSRLSGPDVGWSIPVLAVLAALVPPAILAIVFLYWGRLLLSGFPRDGSSFAILDHGVIVLAILAASSLVSWIVTPIADLLLRAAAMLGYAGWGVAILTSFALGLIGVHFAFMGDLTTEDPALLPHISIATMILGLSVWGAFWGLMALRQKRLKSRPV